jgi:hypothetical protein
MNSTMEQINSGKVLVASRFFSRGPISLDSSTTPGAPVSNPSKPSSGRPKYLITIDTEGDDQWSRSKTITTRNSEYLPRFQAICEKNGLKPT